MQSARLTYRNMCVQDADELFKLTNDYETAYWCGWTRDLTVSDTRRRIAHDWGLRPYWFLVIRKCDGKIIGCISLDERKVDSYEIGYFLGKNYRGKGYMMEAIDAVSSFAFDILGANILWCGYFDGNERSRIVQTKCGFIPHHVEPNAYVGAYNETRKEFVTIKRRKENI